MKKLTYTKTIFVLMTIFSLSCNQQSADLKNYDTYPVYNGSDLGLIYTPEKSIFKIWAPSAEKVKVLIYHDGIGGTPLQEKKMKRSVDGTWVSEFDGDLKGKFYTYRVRVNGDWLNETPGIYATAVGVNGLRAAVVDLSETNPDGWQDDKRPELKDYTDIIISEHHVRDFSISENSGIMNKGKYLAFTEEGTKSPEGEKTGIDHLEELGVTHIHLLPVFDFKTIDESEKDNKQYNWGYDPQNYNVPEGSYSSDAGNPATRIREFKEMVMALHKKGIRVIMDVVYNHTHDIDNSAFTLLVPGYYYRHNADGTASNASACGNETASERPMMRKFMIESLKFWVNEYHIDGFRFDLMGIHDIGTMNMISKELHAIDPTIFLYGEGWTAGSSPLPQEQQALKKFTFRLDSVAAFSDDIRDAIKGKWNEEKDFGFVSGKEGLEESIHFGVVASTDHPQIDYSKVNYSEKPWAAEPFQTITYVSCHDNHTLFDKLLASNPDATEQERIRMDKLANTIVMTSQGVPFLHAGVEMLRTKQGVENSYQSPDSINLIDWSRKHTYRQVFDYYKDLVTFRKQHPAFRMTSTADIQKHLEFLETNTPNMVAFILKEHANGDAWKNIVVIYNATTKVQPFTLPKGAWNIVFNEKGISGSPQTKINNNKVVVAPVSAMVVAEF